MKECSTEDLLARARGADWALSTRLDAIFELAGRAAEADRVVPALVALLQDPATEARVYIVVISALGDMGALARRAVPALIDQIPRALERTVKLKSGVVAAAVGPALKQITGQDFGDDEQRWRSWAGLPETRAATQAPSAALKQACENGDAKACNRLGNCYRLGRCGLPIAKAKAQEAYEKACQGGDMAGCTNLGSCYRSGDCMVAKQPGQALPFYEKACRGGDMTGCASLGSCYENGDCGLARDLRRAGDLYEKACRGGSLDACTNLGESYLTGSSGFQVDEAQGAALLQKACDAGDMGFACYNLAVCYMKHACRGEEVRARAGVDLHKACEAGLPLGCTNMGVCYAEGDCGFAKDELRAGQAFEKACKDGSDARGCSNLRTDRGAPLRKVLSYVRGTLFWADTSP